MQRRKLSNLFSFLSKSIGQTPQHHIIRKPRLLCTQNFLHVRIRVLQTKAHNLDDEGVVASQVENRIMAIVEQVDDDADGNSRQPSKRRDQSSTGSSIISKDIDVGDETATQNNSAIVTGTKLTNVLVGGGVVSTTVVLGEGLGRIVVVMDWTGTSTSNGDGWECADGDGDGDSGDTELEGFLSARGKGQGEEGSIGGAW
ncbi:hypothetical protein DSL72_003855 [Monilinia vaccinii-corymbosi]|uniref:Uncharacterized protein n=1 Tax=Monilinia vaccinii-corymbosi TaxID=61207 RepID=A0A8A3P3C9_9HELO|nr:hypothetical protein DSL72_003855 [Monilinia vaccinii-corymbosi]